MIYRHRIAVLTPSLPQRDLLRGVAERSVAKQTVLPDSHLIGVDYQGIGPAEMRNVLAEGAGSWADWYALLDDDDEMYPDHLERLMAHHSLADIIYSWPDTRGTFDSVFHTAFDPDRLTEESYIGCCAVVRASTWRSLRGMRPIENEDWDFWIRAMVSGARFACVPAVTWKFRLHEGNKYSG